MTFTITKTTFGFLPALTIEGGDTSVVIALRGVTVLAWKVDGVDLIDGYADEEEFADQAGMRSAMMIPFSNRILKGRYSFDGTEIDFNTDDIERAGDTVLHGLLRNADFTVTAMTAEASFATVTFSNRTLRPGGFAGYPFSVDVTIDVVIRTTSLEFEIRGTNVGDTAAPFSCGWHPYFTIGSAPIENFLVTIPAATRIVADAELIPVEGDDAFAPVTTDLDFAAATQIGDLVLDVAFADLELSADGRTHSTITDPASRRTLDVWQERGLIHIFTADVVTRPRASLALEPIEVMTNAFNRADQADSIRLEPGEHRSFRFGVTTTLESP